MIETSFGEIPMSEELAVMTKDQAVEVLNATEELSHVDVELGLNSEVSFKEGEEGAATISIKGDEHPVTSLGLQDAARGVHLPGAFYDFAPRELLLHNLNYLYSRTYGKLRFFLQKGNVIGATVGRSKYYSNVELVEEAEKTIGEGNVLGFHQVSTSLGYSRLGIVADCSFQPIPNNPDDVLYGGIHLETSIIGEKKILITPYIFRQWCSNGSLISENIAQWSRRNEGDRDIREWVQASTEQALRAIDTEFVRIRQLTETSVEGHPVEALQSLFIKFGIPVRTQKMIISQAESQNEGRGPSTMYDLWNAITWVATHSSELSVSSCVELQRAAGQVTREVDLCPSCHQLVERSATQNSSEN
jgi:hypothetical protein